MKGELAVKFTCETCNAFSINLVSTAGIGIERDGGGGGCSKRDAGGGGGSRR